MSHGCRGKGYMDTYLLENDSLIRLTPARWWELDASGIWVESTCIKNCRCIMICLWHMEFLVEISLHSFAPQPLYQAVPGVFSLEKEHMAQQFWVAERSASRSNLFCWKFTWYDVQSYFEQLEQPFPHSKILANIMHIYIYIYTYIYINQNRYSSQDDPARIGLAEGVSHYEIRSHSAVLRQVAVGRTQDWQCALTVRICETWFSRPSVAFYFGSMDPASAPASVWKLVLYCSFLAV